jgi:PAS domain S-box-containing protein
MPLRTTERHSPRSNDHANDRGGAVLRIPLRPTPPPGLPDAVLEALPYSMAVLDHGGTIVAVNATWRRFARENGAPDLAEGSIGLNYLAICHAASGLSSAGAQEAYAGIRAVLEGSQTPFTLEYPCHSPTEQRWFLLHAALLPGGPGGAIVSHIDITERKQLGQALAEQKRVFDGLLAASPDHIFLLDPSGRFVYVNPAAAAVIVAANGRPADEIVGQTARELDLPADFVAQFESQQAQARAGHAVVAETRFPSPRGVRSFEYVLSPIYVEDGQLEALAGITRDVEERRRLERRTQEALQAVLAMAKALTSPDGATGTADSGVAPGAGEVSRRLAEAARSVLGAERILLLGVDRDTERVRPLVRVGRPLEDEEQWYAEAGQFGLSDYPSPGLIPRLRAGEVLEYDCTEAVRRGLPTYGISRLLVAPLRLGANLVGLLAVDFGAAPHGVTADEYALAGATADLAALVLQSDRLYQEREAGRVRELTLQETTQRMDEFLAIASHDLRSPLAVTVGSIDLATQRFERLAAAVLARTPDLAKQVEAARNSLEETSHSVDRLARLVALLFDTSLVHADKLELQRMLCDLVAVVREALEALRLASPQRTIDLQVVAAGPVQVVADADRIGQVVSNYVTNALKYSPEDQAVVVRVDVTGAGARVAVTDHGPGLPQREHERIWQKFYRAEGVRMRSGSSSGLGLGLHICKSIVERHGGQVGVESAVGQGSTFWFTLPLAATTS